MMERRWYCIDGFVTAGSSVPRWCRAGGNIKLCRLALWAAVTVPPALNILYSMELNSEGQDNGDLRGCGSVPLSWLAYCQYSLLSICHTPWSRIKGVKMMKCWRYCAARLACNLSRRASNTCSPYILLLGAGSRGSRWCKLLDTFPRWISRPCLLNEKNISWRVAQG